MKTIRLLLIEDDVSAAMITEVALQDGWLARGVNASITICLNGLEAMRYLQAVEILPNLILCDIKMPLLDGLRLLGILKESDRLRHIPVVMLTTSDDPKDIKRAFEGQCAGYLLKSADFKEFQADMETLQSYWETSKLP